MGLGHHGETDPAGDWQELRESAPDSDDFALSMLLEPMYLLMGRNFEHDATTYGFEECDEQDAMGVVFASEPLTEADDWSLLEFGQIVFLRKDDELVTKTVDTLSV